MDLTFDTNLRLVFRTKLHLAEHKMEKIKLSDEKTSHAQFWQYLIWQFFPNSINLKGATRLRSVRSTLNYDDSLFCLAFVQSDEGNQQTSDPCPQVAWQNSYIGERGKQVTWQGSPNTFPLSCFPTLFLYSSFGVLLIDRSLSTRAWW